MKRKLLTAVFCCFSFLSFAQGMFGAQAGLGFTRGDFSSKLTPSVEGYYLHKIIPHLYAGAGLLFQHHSISKDLNTGSSISYGDVINISTKSSYLFFSPKVDVGIDYRQYFHVHASLGIGVSMGGRQISQTHSPIWTPPGNPPFGADTIGVNTSYNIPSSLTRFGFGISERIPTGRYWNIMLSQEFGAMPGWLSKGTTPMAASYFCFTIGIMHKYPMVFVEY